MALVGKGHKRVHTGLGTDDDATTIASITTAGTTTRDVLLTAEGHATVSASARNDLDFNSIDKHSGCLQQQR
jgi:hypothetical protein